MSRGLGGRGGWCRTALSSGGQYVQYFDARWVLFLVRNLMILKSDGSHEYRACNMASRTPMTRRIGSKHRLQIYSLLILPTP